MNQAKHTVIVSILSIAGLSLTSGTMCSCHSEEENAAEQRAVQFAQDYFNLRYSQAARQCTESSVKWIKLRASGITQDDIDSHNAQTDSATCVVDAINDDGDHVIVTVNVCNFLRCDSIGVSGYMCKEATFDIPLARKGERWLVDLDHLNRPL